MNYFFIMIAVLAVVVSVFWLPFFWVLLSPIALALPPPFRIPALVSGGLAIDFFSGHLFGLGLLGALLAEGVTRLCEKVLHPGSALRSFIVFLSAALVLVLFVALHVFLETFQGIAVGKEALYNWFETAFPSLFIALFFSALLAGRMRPERQERFLLAGE